MKKILHLLFTLVFYSMEAQDKITVNFMPNTPGDYEILIKKILEQNNYEVDINYDTTKKTKTGTTLTYNAKHREKYDELHKFNFELYKEDSQMNKYDKTISYFNFGISDVNQFVEGLSLLLNKNLTFNDSMLRKKVKYFNIQFNIFKLDSVKYIIVAKGAAIRSLEDVQQAFIEKGKQFSNGFSYYLSNLEYNYSAPGPFTTYHTGQMIIGYIIKNESDSITKLDSDPLNLK